MQYSLWWFVWVCWLGGDNKPLGSVGSGLLVFCVFVFGWIRLEFCAAGAAFVCAARYLFAQIYLVGI